MYVPAPEVRRIAEELTVTYPAGQLLPRHRYVAEDIVARARVRREAR